jgi:plastin-1
LNELDNFKRAEAVLNNAAKIDCNKYVNIKAIVNGNPRLNFAFVANLFNTCPGLEPLSEVEKAKLDESLFDSEGDREARGKV